MRALARVYDDYLHLVVLGSSPIRTVTDLRGRRYSVGAPGSGTELIADRILSVAGVTGAGRTCLGIADSIGALQSGRVDAFFWSGGLPSAGISDLARQVPIRLVPLGSFAQQLSRRWDPVYRPGTIPQSTYRGVPDTATVAVPDLLVTRVDSDPRLVEEITGVLFASRRRLSHTVLAVDALDRRVAIATFPVPLHSGAVRYYRRVKN